jgi:dTDP-glucose 4,6-dehydratase
MTILQFAEAVRQVTGTRSPIVHLPLPEDDPKRRRPDISRAREVLGWEPKIGFDEGLRRTVAWFTRCVRAAAGAGHGAQGEAAPHDVMPA